jgi:hypothetical protein
MVAVDVKEAVLGRFAGRVAAGVHGHGLPAQQVGLAADGVAALVVTAVNMTSSYATQPELLWLYRSMRTEAVPAGVVIQPPRRCRLAIKWLILKM